MFSLPSKKLQRPQPAIGRPAGILLGIPSRGRASGARAINVRRGAIERETSSCRRRPDLARLRGCDLWTVGGVGAADCPGALKPRGPEGLEAFRPSRAYDGKG